MFWGHKRKEMANTIVLIHNFKFKWGGRFYDWDLKGRVPFLVGFNSSLTSWTPLGFFIRILLCVL